MNTRQTIEETISLLKKGATIRYYYMVGSVAIFSDKYEDKYIDVTDFIKLRSDGLIACTSDKKSEILGTRNKYQEYFLTEKGEA
jgi:hypothetical protein